MTRAPREALLNVARVACDVAAFVVPAVIYVLCASHEPGAWDTAELQGVPYILGISHPTGFPLYVLLGYAWSHIVALDTVAFRLNVMSGVAVAGAVAVAYAIALQFGARRPVALFAALWFAFVQDVWSHANRAEAQDLAVLCEALAVYSFVRWLKDAKPGWYVASFAFTGFGMAAHPIAIWLFPGLIAGSLFGKQRPSWRAVALSFAAVVCGLGLYLYLPLRSAYVVAHGLDPTMGFAGTDGGIFWNYHNPSTLAGLMMDISANETHTGGYFLSSFNPLHLQEALARLIQIVGEQFGAFVTVGAGAGIYFAWKRDWRTTLFLLIACGASLMFVVTYSYESDQGRYRLLPLMMIVPLLGALSAQALTLKASVVNACLSLALAIGTASNVLAHPEYFRHEVGEGGRWLIDEVRPFVPPGSVILVEWLDATSLAYGAYVDHSLPGRIIVSGNIQLNPQYRLWATPKRRVFILVNPNNIDHIEGAKPADSIDETHELFEVVR